jgi:hypothetical protein
MRVGGHSAAVYAWLLRHEFAVILVAQANGFGRKAGSTGAGFFGGRL